MNRMHLLFAVALILGIQACLFAQAQPAAPTAADGSAQPQVKETLTPKAEYEKRKAALKSDDAAGHYQLAVWAWEKGLLEQAVEELDVVLNLQPDNQNAKLLLQMVNSKLQSERKPAESAPSGGPAGVAPGALMGDDDIARIRLEELRRIDRQVQVVLRNKVLDRFIERYRNLFPDANSERQFRRMSPAEQAIVILTKIEPQDAEMKNDILVKSDPASMQIFRARVWPLVQQSCATSHCHGAPGGAGGLKLYSLGAGSDAAVYTNFYILDSFRDADGRMIDRDRPELSLLLQYGLTPDVAKVKHPGGDITPMFRGTQDPQYRLISAWIDTLIRPRPDYGLTYQAGASAPEGATTAPAPPAAVPAK